jgi:hypothetical protein
MRRLMQQWRVVGDGEHHARQGGTWDFLAGIIALVVYGCILTRKPTKSREMSRSMLREAEEDWAAEIVG